MLEYRVFELSGGALNSKRQTEVPDPSTGISFTASETMSGFHSIRPLPFFPPLTHSVFLSLVLPSSSN